MLSLLLDNFTSVSDMQSFGCVARKKNSSDFRCINFSVSNTRPLARPHAEHCSLAEVSIWPSAHVSEQHWFWQDSADSVHMAIKALSPMTQFILFFDYINLYHSLV